MDSGEIERNRLHNEFLEQIFTCEQKLELAFALALHDDLQQGTSSPSDTYACTAIQS